MVFKDKLRKRAKSATKAKVLGKRNVYDVLLGVVMSEKSYKLSKEENKYVFYVPMDVNKNDVKDAVEYIYNIRPIKVNIVVLPTKRKIGGRKTRKLTKKAVVTLPQGKTIDVGL